MNSTAELRGLYNCLAPTMRAMAKILPSDLVEPFNGLADPLVVLGERIRAKWLPNPAPESAKVLNVRSGATYTGLEEAQKDMQDGDTLEFEGTGALVVTRPMTLRIKQDAAFTLLIE